MLKVDAKTDSRINHQVEFLLNYMVFYSKEHNLEGFWQCFDELKGLIMGMYCFGVLSLGERAEAFLALDQTRERVWKEYNS